MNNGPRGRYFYTMSAKEAQNGREKMEFESLLHLNGLKRESKKELLGDDNNVFFIFVYISLVSLEDDLFFERG